MNRMFLLLMLCLTATALNAQQAAVPEPVVTVTINPPRVVVGQSAVLKIDVMAPNYMTKPPLMPDFQLRNAVTRAGSTVNMSNQRDGISYGGVRFEFLIYPQEAGSYAIAGESVTVTYAPDPPNARETVLPIPRVAFEAFVPDEAAALEPFISATKLTLRQDVQPSSPSLKVGDSVTRTVIVDAEGTPSMLLPPAMFSALDGTKIYPAEPELQDKVDRRSDVLSSTRTDQATYMLLRSGDLTLPAVEVQWWNARKQKVERTRIEPVTFHVADNPSLKAARAPETKAVPNVRRILLFLIDHWRAALAVIIAAGTLAWFGPQMARAACIGISRRRDAYRASEASAYSEMRSTARRGDPAKTYFAVLGWLQRFEPTAPSHTIGALKAAAHDAGLDREIAKIEHHLYTTQAGDPGWSGRELMKRLASARRTLGRRRSQYTTVLPSEINPRAVNRATDWQWRPVAR